MTADRKYLLSENSTVVESGKVLHRVVKGHKLEQRLIVKRTEQVGVHQELLRASAGNHIAKVLQLDGIGKDTLVAVAGQGTFIPAEMEAIMDKDSCSSMTVVSRATTLLSKR